jgi:Xaa-Pro aminopeptidase
MTQEERISTLQRRIRERGLAGALLFYPRDILYYTGAARPSCLAILPDDYSLFITSDSDYASKEVFINKQKMREEQGLETVYRESFSKLSKGNMQIGTEMDILTVEQLSRFRKAFPGFEFSDVSPLVLEQRQKKEPIEIEMIRKACEVIHRGHEAVLSNLHIGVTELEIAAAVEKAHRLAGHEGMLFMRQPDFFMSTGPVASGPNLLRISGVLDGITGVGLSPSVPSGPSQRAIEEGDSLIVDIPTMVSGYHADQTRTYFVGKANKEIKSLFEDLKAIADKLISQIKPGMKCSEIYHIAYESARQLGRLRQFQRLDRDRTARFIGHGIGLELNEPPILSEYDHSEISEDYVIAIEMHMMDEKLGVVKLEDMILIRETGNMILTQTPRVLFEL